MSIMDIIREIFGTNFRESVPKELSEASHRQANEAQQLSATLRKCKNYDPIGSMVTDMQRQEYGKSNRSGDTRPDGERTE